MAQSFSLHPSWDRMYMSGMTVREIADYTGQPRSTVHRHLRVRETLVEDLRSVHEAAREARGPDWPPTRWQHSYKAVQDFYAAHSRLPAATDTTERSLALWLHTQRARYRHGSLPTIQVTLMEKIPGWNIGPRQTSRDEQWRQSLHELVAYINEAGQMPRWSRHGSEHERILGVWLHTQHQRRAERRLLPWRLEALDAAVPGWHSTM